MAHPSKTIIRLSDSCVRRTFEAALSFSPAMRGDFFHDLRQAFENEIENILREVGISTTQPKYPRRSIRTSVNLVRLDPFVKLTGWHNDIQEELDAEFCAGYGADDFSLRAVNYLDRAYCELPSLLPFLKLDSFSLGNFCLSIANSDSEIEVQTEHSLGLVGYTVDVTGRRQKETHLIIIGAFVRTNAHRDWYIQQCIDCQHDASDLDEIMIGHIRYPALFICRRCGQLFNCSCFNGYFSLADDVFRCLPYGDSEPELHAHVAGLRSAPGICSLCTGKVPRTKYGSEMYYSIFLQRYLPYHALMARKEFGRDLYTGGPQEDQAAYRRIENELRAKFDYPLIGEKWISETMLFKLVSTMLSPRQVVHHYRGRELEGLELDVWIPELQIGIEYQGQQHFEAFEHWGGDEGLTKRRENDTRKKQLCANLGYKLIEFNYDEPLTEACIGKKIARYLDQSAKT